MLSQEFINDCFVRDGEPYPCRGDIYVEYEVKHSVPSIVSYDITYINEESDTLEFPRVNDIILQLGKSRRIVSATYDIDTKTLILNFNEKI